MPGNNPTGKNQYSKSSQRLLQGKRVNYHLLSTSAGSHMLLDNNLTHSRFSPERMKDRIASKAFTAMIDKRLKRQGLSRRDAGPQPSYEPKVVWHYTKIDFPFKSLKKK